MHSCTQTRTGPSTSAPCTRDFCMKSNNHSKSLHGKLQGRIWAPDGATVKTLEATTNSARSKDATSTFRSDTAFSLLWNKPRTMLKTGAGNSTFVALVHQPVALFILHQDAETMLLLLLLLQLLDGSGGEKVSRHFQVEGADAGSGAKGGTTIQFHAFRSRLRNSSCVEGVFRMKT